MPSSVSLRCRCGKVRGVAREVSATTGNRVVCHCSDCQAFAHFLHRPEVLDARGGSDIFQMASTRMVLREGVDQLRGMRLSPKGLLRWYTDCCKTPVGNTVSAGLPFVGVLHSFMDHEVDGRSANDAMGPPIALVHGRDAIGGLPPGAHPKVPLWLIGRSVLRVAGWFMASRGKTTPFFDPKTKAPIVPPRVLTVEERRAL